MTLEEYLNSLLGKKKAKKLIKALGDRKPVIISGVNGSGKTTLARVLRSYGFHDVYEDFETYELHITKKIDEMKRDFDLESL